MWEQGWDLDWVTQQMGIGGRGLLTQLAGGVSGGSEVAGTRGAQVDSPEVLARGQTGRGVEASQGCLAMVTQQWPRQSRMSRESPLDKGK